MKSREEVRSHRSFPCPKSVPSWRLKSRAVSVKGGSWLSSPESLWPVLIAEPILRSRAQQEADQHRLRRSNPPSRLRSLSPPSNLQEVRNRSHRKLPRRRRHPFQKPHPSKPVSSRQLCRPKTSPPQSTQRRRKWQLPQQTKHPPMPPRRPSVLRVRDHRRRFLLLKQHPETTHWAAFPPRAWPAHEVFRDKPSRWYATMPSP